MFGELVAMARSQSRLNYTAEQSGSDVLGSLERFNVRTRARTNYYFTIVVLAFAGLFLVGYAKEETKVKPPTNVVVTVMVTAAAPGPTVTSQTAVPANHDFTTTSWMDIKDDSYDMRAHFIAGFKRLEAKVDIQVNELTVKGASLSNPVARKDWDLAMAEMTNASSSLKLMGEELSRTIPEKWKLQKYLAGRAWLRTQEAYAKVPSNTAP